jgi:hypothetical protein
MPLWARGVNSQNRKNVVWGLLLATFFQGVVDGDGFALLFAGLQLR